MREYPETELARQPIGYWSGEAYRVIVGRIRAALAVDDLTQPHWWSLNHVAAAPGTWTGTTLTDRLSRYDDQNTDFTNVFDDLLTRGWMAETPTRPGAPSPTADAKPVPARPGALSPTADAKPVPARPGALSPTADAGPAPAHTPTSDAEPAPVLTPAGAAGHAFILTPAGAAGLERARERNARVHEQTHRGISAADYAAALNVLRRMIDNLGGDSDLPS